MITGPRFAVARRNAAGAVVGPVGEFESLKYAEKLNQPSGWSMRCPPSTAASLSGGGIWIKDQITGRIWTGSTERETVSDDPEELATVEGFATLNVLRVPPWPNPAARPDDQTNDYEYRYRGRISDGIADIINKNIGPGARSERHLAASVRIENPVTDQRMIRARWTPDLLAICHKYGTPLGVAVDAVIDQDGFLRVTVRGGVDSDLVFSGGQGQVLEWDVTHTAPEHTHAVVAGSGEGIDRLTVMVSRPDGPRKEVFLDARHLDTVNDLGSYGIDYLETSRRKIALDVVLDPQARSGMSGIRLGDRVSVWANRTEFREPLTEIVTELTPDEVNVTGKVGWGPIPIPEQALQANRRTSNRLADFLGDQ